MREPGEQYAERYRGGGNAEGENEDRQFVNECVLEFFHSSAPWCWRALRGAVAGVPISYVIWRLRRKVK
jgi:hypothetical protein